MQNPLHPAYHYPAQVAPETHFQDGNGFGYSSRPGSAYGMAEPFHPPYLQPGMTPPPMQNQLNVPHFLPPPLPPYLAPYPSGGYPTAYSPLTPPGLAIPNVPAGQESDRMTYSRYSSRLPSRVGRASREERWHSRESSSSRPRNVENHARSTSRDRSSRPKDGVEPKSIAKQSPEPPNEPADQRPRSPPAIPERGRSRYRIVSTATTSSIQSSQNDQPRGTPEAGREGGSESNYSALTSVSAENTGEDGKNATSKGQQQRPHDEQVTARKLQTGFGHGLRRSSRSDNEPPPNAPTAPASLRRTIIIAKSQSQASLTPKSAESGSWSQSKRWISQETKERVAFQKLMHTLHYMGADKSPFIPQTPAALAAFRVREAERRSRKLGEELRRKVERLSRRKREEARGQGHNRPRSKLELFAGKTPRDRLSAVFAADICFIRSVPGLHVEWPSLAELKEEGDKRAVHYGRYFPLPRVNKVTSRLRQREDGKPSGSSITWEKKAVKKTCRFVRPVSCELEPECFPQPQVQIEELHGPLQALLNEINETESESESE